MTKENKTSVSTDLSGLFVVGHPEVDPADLQQLVPDLKAGLVGEAVAGHRGHEHPPGDPPAAAPLLDLDAEGLAALLHVDLTDLPRAGFMLRRET